ncbi:sorting nexin-19 isoform X2 [Lithobates pipiens]
MADVVSEVVFAPPKDPRKGWMFLAGGALIAWVILVHLLVNVWLLLLFSAIMAAAGAWLGPQFILGSSTPVHLERFVTLDRSARSANAEEQLDKEIRLTIQKIVQDFVSSWYRRLSQETAFEDEYDTALDSQSLGTLQPMAYHTVNRRYREFLNLQTRLEERADLRKFVKHIKGPKKFLPDLPFGNMDSEKVEARKSQLESFLRQLCAVPEIASSEEVQEFLALNTDARIAFVKKPFLVSRIDKIVVNAIVDTLKTAFPRSEPQSPTDELSENEVDGKSQNDKKSTKSRLRFPSSKIAPVLNSCDIQEKILYSVREGSTVSDVLSLGGMESFVQKQIKILNEISASQERSTTSGSPQLPSTLNAQAAGLDGSLAAVALEVLWLVMREQWSWLCTDNMQKVTHLLCGSLIQRWLEVQVDNVTCMQRWALYLRLLQQAIWPGGALRTQPRPPRTRAQREAAYNQALQSLKGIIPDLVQEMLGAQKCHQAWKSILDSLQHPPINRHLLYCIWDILLESLTAAPAS